MPTDNEVLAWDACDVEAFAEQRSAEDIAQVIQQLVKIGGAQAIGVLCKFLSVRGPDLWEKPMPSQLALRGLVLCGAEGVDALGTALLTQRVRYAAKVVMVLIRVAEGKGLTNPMKSGRIIPDDFIGQPLPPGTEESAQRTLTGIASEAVLGEPNAMRLFCGRAFGKHRCAPGGRRR